ncbi:MAG: recombination regulator RecX [Betaproteobacteria bacterium]|nr:recombination regulator RecX [Betaproteobacteria bacterium]
MIREKTLRERALRLLAGREHSRVELKRKLAAFAENEDELDALLDELVASRLLSDERYAEARAHTLTRRYGSLRLAHDLKQQGVADATRERVVADARRTDLERAREIWRKRFGEVARDAPARAKQMRFLQSRGFAADVIRSVVQGEEPVV